MQRVVVPSHLATALLRCFSVRLGVVFLALWLCLARFLPAEAQWQPDRGLVLIGTAVTMNDQRDVIPGAHVFIRDGRILAIAQSDDRLPPAANDAVRVETTGVIYPGLIDLHNHPEYNVFPLWVVPERYQDRYQWRGRKAYKAAVAEPYELLSTKEYLNLQAELGKYAELKAIIGGTTAIHGMARHKTYSATEYLVRNVEYTEVGAKPVRRMLDPARNEQGWMDAKKAALASGAWLFHLGEGLPTSPKASQEFALLGSKGLDLRLPSASRQIVNNHGGVGTSSSKGYREGVCPGIRS
jgi:hypothetical protein